MAKQNNNSKSLESWIWDAACSIRGAKDAPKYKDFILPLIFTKRLCDVFDDEVIHASVERITHWMNSQSSSTPIKFGLVELRFYGLANGDLIAVPKTLLRTREISRHVVVVDIRGEGAASAETKVVDEFETASGRKIKEERLVKATRQLLTKTSLLAEISAADLPTVESLIDQLESIGLDQNGTATYLRYGITYPAEGGEFYPLIYLSNVRLIASLPKKIVDILGIPAMVEYRNKLNSIASFYNIDRIADPYLWGKEIKYQVLEKSLHTLVSTIEEIKLLAQKALREQDDR